jgi:hypothetical protein
MGKMISEYKILVGNAEEKRPLGRSRCKRLENIKWKWTGYFWLRIGTVVFTVLNLRVP